jgi:CHASE3 domain sensor protein
MIPAQKTKRTLFWIGLSLPMAALMAMTWLVHQAGGQFNTSFNSVLQNYKVLDKFEQAKEHFVDAEANQRGYLLTGHPEYLPPYQVALASTRDDLEELKKMTANDPVQQVNLAALERLAAVGLAFDPATAYSSGQVPTDASVVTLTARGNKKIDDLQLILFQVREEQERALVKHQQEAEADVVSSQIMSMVLIGGVAIALVLVVVILLRLEKLQQFVTVCAWTGQVRFQGQWLRLDQYLERQFGISVSHSLSQDAAKKMMREIEDLNRPGRTQEKTPSANDPKK